MTVLLLLLCAGPEDEAAATITVEDARRHMEWLAHDDRQGREAGSDGGHAAALYVEKHYRACGWEPGGRENTFFQAFGQEGKAASLTIKDGQVQKGMKNVIAVRPGSDPARRDQYIVVGAHYDHVGTGWAGATRGTQGQIHNGSDDNASGTAALMELAEALPKGGLKRTVVLVSFDGEEKGLWGSKAFTAEPTLPIEKCRWMINLDMASRNETKDIAVGRGDATDVPLNRALKGAEAKYALTFDTKSANEFMRRSDQWNFVARGVPSIFLFGKVHPDYHTERDDVERANFEKVQLISRLALYILYRLADDEP